MCFLSCGSRFWFVQLSFIKILLFKQDLFLLIGQIKWYIKKACFRCFRTYLQKSCSTMMVTMILIILINNSTT
jgi:hypothetical protein